MIFEGLTGQPPFDSNDEAATLWSHMSQDPPSVSQRRPGLPVAVDDVLRRALAKDPEHRQPTCQTLVAELRAALDRHRALPGRGRDRSAEHARPDAALSPSGPAPSKGPPPSPARTAWRKRIPQP